VLLLYPDDRRAALGSPGFRQVYRTLDDCAAILVDWGWFDETEGRVRHESGGSGKRYDCIAFSVPYELLYRNVVRALTALRVEPDRERRDRSAPLVVLGGAAPTINPAVAGAIADVVYVGEAEEHFVETIHRVLDERETGAALKLTPMSGISIPENKKAAPRFFLPVERIDSSFHERFDDPGNCAFRDAGLVEVGRGCSRGCRFCAAGFIYRPVRHRRVEDILRDVESYRGAARRIGLVGASISDHRDLKAIIKGILAAGFGVTTSSFRADMVDEELARLLKRGGVKTVTIAPEGGSERMRKIMNKNLSEEDILDAVRACRDAGIRRLKLYFMVGLPWEEESDIDAIPALTAEIADEFKAPGSQVSVSVNPFVPKPQTPFQWCGMAEPAYLKAVFRKLAKELRKVSRVTLKTMSARTALKEAVVSLGNESVGKAVIESARGNVSWNHALKGNGIDVSELVHREKRRDENFPWDAVTGEETKAALFASYEKARLAAETSV